MRTSFRAALTPDGAIAVLGGCSRNEENLSIEPLDGGEPTLLRGEVDSSVVLSVALLDDSGHDVVTCGDAGFVTRWQKEKQRWRTKLERPASYVSYAGGRVVALEGQKVVFLDPETGATQGALDLGGKVDDAPRCCLPDPARSALWVGTARGAVLRFSLSR